MKKIILSVIGTIALSVVVVTIIIVVRRGVLDIEDSYYATVVDAKCSVVLLDTEEKVSLAGILIPWSDDKLNFRPELMEIPRTMLRGERVKIELVERHRSGAYHKYDLVRIYLDDGTCVNTHLLENGLAFFSHGYYRDKDKDFASEAKAKREGKGVWANKGDLQLLYVGSQQWEGIHYPECPEVNKIRTEDRIEYYTRPVKVHWYRDGAPEGCPHCDEIRKTKPKELQ